MAEPLFQIGNLVADVEQRLERERGLFAERVAAVGQAVLRQIADRQAGGLDDGAAVRFVEPGEHPQQRGLAGAVRAAEADTLAVVDLPRDAVEQGSVAERFCE